LKLIRIVKKKVLKGITAEDTAEMLEEPLERIQQIYNVIREHADWTEDEIYDRTAAALPGGPFFSNASEE